MTDAIPVYPDFPRDIWTLGEALGHGGQGHTFLATHVSRGEKVALKRLHARHLADLKHLELFVREAEVLRTLDHPDVPRCVDLFFVRDGAGPAELYLAQTFIEGRRLDRVVREGPLPDADTLVGWLKGLLDVLTYLHTRLPPVVHRDIKPSNILIRPDGRAALVDFGAVATGWAREDASTLVGTPGYAPPEQLAGIVGPRADLFALGATAWHVVTGRPPQPDPDSGALAIPPGLDTRLAAFIAATTALVPSARPATAAAAKELLTRPAPPAPAPAPAASRASPSAVATQALTAATTPVPQLALFKDFGPPPRVLDGVLRDILLAGLPAPVPPPPRPPPPRPPRPPARGPRARPSTPPDGSGGSVGGSLILFGIALPVFAVALEADTTALIISSAIGALMTIGGVAAAAMGSSQAESHTATSGPALPTGPGGGDPDKTPRAALLRDGELHWADVVDARPLPAAPDDAPGAPTIEVTYRYLRPDDVLVRRVIPVPPHLVDACRVGERLPVLTVPSNPEIWLVPLHGIPT